MAWIVPGMTLRLTPSLATTPGNRFTMSRSSMAGITTVVVVVTAVFLVAPRRWGAGCPAPHLRPRSSSRSAARRGRHLDVSADDLLLELLDGAGVVVDVLVGHRVADAVVLEVVELLFALELSVEHVGDRLVGRDVDPLQRRGEDVRLLVGRGAQVLVRVDADGVDLSGLLARLDHGLEQTLARGTGGGVDHIDPFAVHRGRDRLALGRVGETGEVRRLGDVLHLDRGVRVHGLRAGGVPGLELLDEVVLDAADEAELAGL